MCVVEFPRKENVPRLTCILSNENHFVSKFLKTQENFSINKNQTKQKTQPHTYAYDRGLFASMVGDFAP